MRRSIVVAATAALVGSGLAFAPATQQAETTHQVTFSEDGTATVEGGMPGGANVSPFIGDPVCSTAPDSYCETILLTVEQPVADEAPDAIDFGLGEVGIDVTAAVPGADFDLFVYESDADATKGTQIASSGNLSACTQLCGTAPDPAGLYNDCLGVDECVEFNVSTSDLDGTKHFLVEVVYFATPAGYTANLGYTRTDGRNADGTTGSTEPAEEAPAAAPSAERIDVTGGFEKVGDWGGGGDVAALGDALGQDLEAAFVEYAEDVFTFTIDVTNLPAAGGTPEVTRYVWDLTYDGTPFQLDGKFTNYSRGTCDPTAGNCPPPRNPGIGFFALRGNCVTEGNVTTCEEIAALSATFDPSDGTIAVPVSAELLAPDGVAACDAVGAGVVTAQISAFFSLSTAPQDTATAYQPLVVPHADPTLSC